MQSRSESAPALPADFEMQVERLCGRAEREVAGDAVTATLEGLGKRRMSTPGLCEWVITRRMKSAASIWEKMWRKQRVKSYSLEDVKDLVGVRVIVESTQCARALAGFVREHRLFDVREWEDFLGTPRADGYRGFHFVLAVDVNLGRPIVVPVELQIRTMLQHQWSELSHAEFYKHVSDIPPSLLARMRALSEILQCADVESENLRRERVADECRQILARCLREDVFERCGRRVQRGEAQALGRAGNSALEFEKQMRRCLVSEGEAEHGAFLAMEAIASLVAGSDGEAVREVAEVLAEIVERIRALVEPVPLIRRTSSRA